MTKIMIRKNDESRRRTRERVRRKKRKYIMDHDIKHAGEGFSSLEEGRRAREGGL